LSIHPTAIVDSHAEIDPAAEIGPYCVIDANVRVDAGTRLYHNVYLTGWTHVGPQCTLHPGVIVGHEPQDVKYRNERTFCRIGKGTILREYVTVHRGTMPESETVVGESCFLLCGAHVAHNCIVGNSVTMVNGAKLAGHVEVGNRAMISGDVVIHQFCRIGELVMLQGNAGISMDIPPFMLAALDGRVAGLNRVGLRRAGLSREEIADIRDAYRTLYRGGLPFRQAVEALATQVRTDPGRRLLSFLQANSRRGIAGRRRAGRPSASPDVDAD